MDEPSAFQVMTHPKVLECFGAVMNPEGSGQMFFPDMLKAAQWSQLWAEHGGEKEHVVVQAGITPFEEVIIHVGE